MATLEEENKYVLSYEHPRFVFEAHVLRVYLAQPTLKSTALSAPALSLASCLHMFLPPQQIAGTVCRNKAKKPAFKVVSSNAVRAHVCLCVRVCVSVRNTLPMPRIPCLLVSRFSTPAHGYSTCSLFSFPHCIPSHPTFSFLSSFPPFVFCLVALPLLFHCLMHTATQADAAGFIAASAAHCAPYCRQQ